MLSILCCTLSYYSTFLDDRHFRDVATAVSGHREVGHLYLGWGQEGGCTHGRVIEDGGAVALPTAFPPVAVNSCLKLDGGAQPSLFTFIRVEVLHIPAGEKRNPMLYSPSPRSVTLSHTLSINHLISAGSGVGLKEKKKRYSGTIRTTYLNLWNNCVFTWKQWFKFQLCFWPLLWNGAALYRSLPIIAQKTLLLIACAGVKGETPVPIIMVREILFTHN